MSAVAGLWRLDGRNDAGEACARMLRALRVYGPHAASHWDGGFVACGRCQFRVLPEDRFDRQPLFAVSGKSVLVADLRLDNRDELMAALGLSTPEGRTLCDADILRRGLERWGDGCLDRLVGDFAFAFWQGDRRRLLLARDPLGQRALYYHRTAKTFAFASMPKGLHALGEFPRAPDEERIAEFVGLLPEHGSRSFFKEIERVEPGHALIVSAHGTEPRRYWQPSRRLLAFKHPAEYEEALRHHLDRAVAARLRGAGDKVGAHLSAGLDSSIVATAAARLLAPRGGRVIAFTGAPRQGYDAAVPPGRFASEDRHAALTAAMHPNMEHVVVRAGASPLLDRFDRYFYWFEQPILNPCNAPWFFAINDAACERALGVMFAAFMGNFTISYDGGQVLADLFAHGRWLRWLRLCSVSARSGNLHWKGALVRTFGPYLPAALWLWLSRVRFGHERDVMRYTAIDRARLQQLDLAARARERGLDLAYRPRKDAFATRLWGLRRVDMGNFNKGMLAGWGIDMRDPTADTRLIEFCLTVPAEQFVRGGVPRALARQAFADRLPPAVRNERRHGLQGADWHERLCAAKAEVCREVERLEACGPAARVLDVARLRRLVAAWPQSGWHNRSVVTAYRIALLRALSIGHFLRMASGSNC